MQDVYRTGLTQETHVLDNHAGYTAPIRQHELDYSRSGLYLPCLADVHHEVGVDHTDHLSDVCIVHRIKRTVFVLSQSWGEVYRKNSLT